MPIPDWRRLVDHVQAVPERVYETWTSRDGWDNHTPFGATFGEDGVSWCVIFDWDMYAAVGLPAVVPKVDNVNTFSAWARARGQWSEYPSVGAWVNLSNGGHTEIVTGFDATYVYTKGGNSVQAGSTDAGQGNGVWSHRTERRSTRVVGYFAPRFPDGVCPPTADPHDPRGGTAVTSWRWTGAATPAVQEDTLPTAQEIAQAVADHTEKSDTSGRPTRLGTFIRYADNRHAQVMAQLGALTGLVTKLAAGGGLTAEQATAAAEAGATAALDKLGHALTD